MTETTITLDNISLIDFLGVENKNIREVASAFPRARIVARGNEIKLIGNPLEVKKIEGIFELLLEHFHRYGKISEEHIASYIQQEAADLTDLDEDEIIIFGNKGLVVKPKSENQKKIVMSAKKNDLIFAIGPAGTGKTYISVALAVRALKNKEIKKIVITRPAVEAGESLGFLPGDLKEKIDPYLRPIYDALDDMIPAEKLKYYYENRIIEIAPLAYMRGRTLHNAFILLDEAQNTTNMQMKMFLTRMGPKSKMIVTGDRSQIDLPGKQKSGLVEAVDILKNIPGIAFVELSDKDVMRHKLIGKIINAYDKAIK
ncbi:PhoH family protein [Cytophagaceae bacterium ABcell3]|nr:PhoH family protein [Cytophagaceae bacterium ABcell3]